MPYDYDAYFSSPERYVMVATNCLTGEANYFEEKQSKERVIDIVRASSSLPFVCPVAYIDDVPMLDGGIVDSIPLLRAREEGYTHNLVVLVTAAIARRRRTLRYPLSSIRNILKYAKRLVAVAGFITNS